MKIPTKISIFLLALVCVACAEPKSPAPSAPANEATDRDGKPATVGPSAPSQPVPLNPPTPANPEAPVPASIQAVDSVSQLHCDTSTYNHWLLDRYEMSKFDQQNLLPHRGRAAEAALARLDRAPFYNFGRQLGDSLKNFDALVSGEITGVAPNRGAVWLPKGCELKHVALLSLEKGQLRVWLDRALFRNLSSEDQDLAMMHVALAKKMVEGGDQKFLAVRRMNRALFGAKNPDLETMFYHLLLMNPNQPLELSLKNGDASYMFADDASWAIYRYRGGVKYESCMAVLADGQKFGDCEGKRNSVEVNTQDDQRILRVVKRWTVLYLYSPTALGLPSSTVDYEFSSTEMGKQSEYVKVSLSSPHPVDFGTVNFVCAAGKPIYSYMRKQPPFQASLSAENFVKCETLGNAEINVAGQSVFVPISIYKGYYYNPGFSAYVTSAANPAEVKIGGDTFPLKGGTYLSFNEKKNLRIYYGDSRLEEDLRTIETAGGKCQVYQEGLDTDPERPIFRAWFASPCSVKFGGFKAKLSSWMDMDLNSRVIVSLTSYSGQVENELQYGKFTIPFHKAEQRDDSTLRWIEVANVHPEFSYFDLTTGKMEKSKSYFGAKLYCYNPVEKRLESRDSQWCNK